MSINCKELFAVIVGLMLSDYLNGKSVVANRVVVHVDNETAKSLCISKKPNIKSEVLAQLTKVVSLFIMASKVRFHFDRISTELNVTADLLSRSRSFRQYKAGDTGLSITDLLKFSI